MKIKFTILLLSVMLISISVDAQVPSPRLWWASGDSLYPVINNIWVKGDSLEFDYAEFDSMIVAIMSIDTLYVDSLLRVHNDAVIDSNLAVGDSAYFHNDVFVNLYLYADTLAPVGTPSVLCVLHDTLIVDSCGDFPAGSKVAALIFQAADTAYINVKPDSLARIIFPDSVTFQSGVDFLSWLNADSIDADHGNIGILDSDSIYTRVVNVDTIYGHSPIAIEDQVIFGDSISLDGVLIGEWAMPDSSWVNAEADTFTVNDVLNADSAHIIALDVDTLYGDYSPIIEAGNSIGFAGTMGADTIYNQTTTTAGAGIGLYIGTQLDNAGPFDVLEVYMQETGAGEQTFRAELWSESGGEPDTMISFSDTLTLPNGELKGWQTFTWSSYQDITPEMYMLVHVLSGSSTVEIWRASIGYAVNWWSSDGSSWTSHATRTCAMIIRYTVGNYNYPVTWDDTNKELDMPDIHPADIDVDSLVSVHASIGDVDITDSLTAVTGDFSGNLTTTAEAYADEFFASDYYLTPGAKVTETNDGEHNVCYWIGTFTYAGFTGSAASEDVIIIDDAPAGFKILELMIDVTTQFTGGSMSAGTISAGFTTAAYEDILSDTDCFTAPILVGDEAGEIAYTAVQGGYMSSWAATKDVIMQLNFTGDTVDNLTAGECTVYITYQLH